MSMQSYCTVCAFLWYISPNTESLPIDSWLEINYKCVLKPSHLSVRLFFMSNPSDYKRKLSSSTIDYVYSATNHSNSICRKTCLVDLCGFSSLRPLGISIKFRLQINCEYMFCMIANLKFIPINFQTIYKIKLYQMWNWGTSGIVCVMQVSCHIRGANELQQCWIQMSFTRTFKH